MSTSTRQAQPGTVVALARSLTLREDFGEKLLDGHCRMRGPHRPEDVECVLRKRQFSVGDRLTADVPQPLAECPALLDRDQRVITAMQHEKWWGVRIYIGDRRRVAERINNGGSLQLEDVLRQR